MHRIAISLLLGLTLAFGAVGSAFAHVHGVTPLHPECSADGPPNNNANAGGNGTEDGPADSENGGPIGGVIPRDATPEDTPAAGKPGEAGQHSANCDQE